MPKSGEYPVPPKASDELKIVSPGLAERDAIVEHLRATATRWEVEAARDSSPTLVNMLKRDAILWRCAAADIEAGEHVK